METLGPQLTGAVPGLVLQGVPRGGRPLRAGAAACCGTSWRGELQPSRRSLKQVVYGKVYADDEGELVGPVVTALRKQLPNGPGSSLPFLVPRFQAYVPDSSGWRCSRRCPGRRSCRT